MTETELENTIEQYASGLDFNMEGVMPILTVVGIAVIALFYGIMYLSKRRKEKQTIEELSEYYDAYMESDVDMSFEDYIFCRKHHIDVDRKTVEKRKEKILTELKADEEPGASEDINGDADEEE